MIQKTGRCIGCGAHRILRQNEICKRCNSIGFDAENEEESE
ncbi:MAG: hypothetical protein V1740_05890 [Candidatus Woesearchaeota archaeon]